MTEKYFSYCIEAGTMGNWTEMIPGMIDVCENYIKLLLLAQLT